MNTPDDEPSAEEGAELSDEELRSKFLEFRDRVNAARGDDEEMRRLATEMLAFVEKHRARLIALGIQSEESIAKLTAALGRLRKSQEAVDRATEQLYQATADMAECEWELTEGIFDVMHAIHAKWDELDFTPNRKSYVGF